MEEAAEIPEAPEQPVEAPAKRGRGRPPGAKNKVRISVQAPEACEACEPQEAVVMKPRAKPAPAPVVSEQTPHATFHAAMAAWQALAHGEHQAKRDHYHRLVSDSVR